MQPYGRPKFLAVLEATFAVVVWGGSFVATKVALKDVSPVTVVWLRFSMGVVIIGLSVMIRKQWAIPARKDLLYFALLGFLGISFHQWLQSTGLLTAQATTTAWIVATTPIFMAVLGWVVLKERLNWIQVGGIALAACGVLVVVTSGDILSISVGNFGSPGDFLILISAVNWAVFSALSRRGLQKYPATRMMFFVMAFGWFFVSILFFADDSLSQIANLTRQGWAGILFLGVLCSGVAYIFWYDALQVLPVAKTGAFVYLEPFITVVVAAIVLDEQLIAASLFGGAAILLGVWLVNRN